MRQRKLPASVAIFLLFWASCEGVRTNGVSISSSSSSDKDSAISSHRQYTHSLDSGNSVSYGSNKPAALVSAALASSNNVDQKNGRNNGVSYETAKAFGGSSSGINSGEFGGGAEAAGTSFHSLFHSPSSSSGYPASQPSPGGYPSSGGGGYQPSPSAPIANPSVPSQQQPPGDPAQGPSYTYYYQHYPNTGGVQQGGWGAAEGQEDGHGLFGELNGPGGGIPGIGGLGGLGGLLGLKGIGILAAAAAKGILAIKPFLILGLLTLIAIPVLLLFLPLPIISITGNGRNGRSDKNDPTVVTYLADLSKRVLTSEECLERVLCKMPKVPDTYHKKARVLWETYGENYVKNERVKRGLEAYFVVAKEKNRIFKCNQRFKCSNKYI